MADVQVTSAELVDGTLTVTGSGFTRTTTQLFVDDSSVPFDTAVDFDGTQITAQLESAKVVWAVKGAVESDHISVAAAPTAPADATTPPDPATGDPQTPPTGSGESPSPTTSPGADQTASELSPGPEPDHTASQTEQASEAYDPAGDAHEPGYKTAEPNVTPGDLVQDDLKTTSDATPESINQAAVNLGADATQERAVAREANAPDRTPLKEDEHLPGADFRTRVENTAAGDLGKVIGPRDPYPKDNPPDPRESFHRIHGFYPSEEGGAQDAQAAQMDADPKT